MAFKIFMPLNNIECHCDLGRMAWKTNMQLNITRDKIKKQNRG
jgi:hypothetical protein